MVSSRPSRVEKLNLDMTGPRREHELLRQNDLQAAIDWVYDPDHIGGCRRLERHVSHGYLVLVVLARPEINDLAK